MCRISLMDLEGSATHVGNTSLYDMSMSEHNYGVCNRFNEYDWKWCFTK